MELGRQFPETSDPGTMIDSRAPANQGNMFLFHGPGHGNGLAFRTIMQILLLPQSLVSPRQPCSSVWHGTGLPRSCAATICGACHTAPHCGVASRSTPHCSQQSTLLADQGLFIAATSGIRSRLGSSSTKMTLHRPCSRTASPLQPEAAWTRSMTGSISPLSAASMPDLGGNYTCAASSRCLWPSLHSAMLLRS